MIKRVFVALMVAAMLPATVQSAEETIVVLGDSLSSAHGFAADQSWVALLAERLEREAYGYEVVNASISGDTTSGGLARLPRLLDVHDPAVVIIELGGNDGLRGQPVASMKDNLGQMIELVQEAGAEPVLAGIRIPPNYGVSYTEMFTSMYSELAQEYEIALVPFLMEGVALNSKLMQGDRIHPNAEAQPVMLENVWSVLEDVL